MSLLLLCSMDFVFPYDITYWPTSTSVCLPSQFLNNGNGRCKSSLKKDEEYYLETKQRKSKMTGMFSLFQPAEATAW